MSDETGNLAASSPPPTLDEILKYIKDNEVHLVELTITHRSDPDRYETHTYFDGKAVEC